MSFYSKRSWQQYPYLISGRENILLTDNNTVIANIVTNDVKVIIAFLKIFLIFFFFFLIKLLLLIVLYLIEN